jgi:phosphomannomutase
MNDKLHTCQKGYPPLKEIEVGEDADISIPPKRAVKIIYSKDFFQKHGLLGWVSEFKLGTAGYRDTFNLADFFKTDAPFNAHTIMMIAEAMARIYERRGYRSIHLGGEVRRFTQEIIQLVGRIFAFHGVSVHLHSDKATTPIWASSFGVFYNELDGGANVTASHSQNFKQGFKPIDEKGMQLLEMADEIRDEVKHMGEEAIRGVYSITLSADPLPLIKKDFRYIEAYTDYLKGIVPEEAFQLIHKAQRAGMRVGVSTVGGSMYENSVPIFNHFGISTGTDGMIQYFHWEKRDDFHRVGEIEGENYGCDPTKPIIYRNIGLKEKLLSGEIDFGFIWDPDGDRYNMVTIADDSIASEAVTTGLEVERIEKTENCIVYFKPNQIYFIDTALKLEMMARSEELFQYDWVISTTYPTSKSIGELADIFNRKYAGEFSKKGTKIRQFRTPVGFKNLGNMVGEIERQLNDGCREVVLRETTGEMISLGKRPRILILAEESGGAVMGSSDWIRSKNGNRKSLAMKEKDGLQVSMMNLSIMGKLFLEKKSFAQLYMEKIEEYDILYRYYNRIDKKLFDESLTGKEREEAREIGYRAKDFMVETFRSLTEGKSKDQVDRELREMVGGQIPIPGIKRVFWAGDGTYLDFGQFWFELRASGTDAVLRFYIEGKEPEVLDEVNNAFVRVADKKLRALWAKGS